jgi:hypothetical protein
MGVRAGLTEIPRDLYAEVAVGGEPDIAGGTRHSIDKAWYDFHVVFRSKGPPLSLAMSGDYRHPLSPHSLDEFCKGNYEYYVGFASPALVEEVANALANVTASNYKEWETACNCDQCPLIETFFAALKTAYLGAATRKNALMIVIA